MNAVGQFLADGEHSHVVNELPIPAEVIGLIFFVGFVAFAIVTFNFRDVASRHSEKAEKYRKQFNGHAPHHR